MKVMSFILISFFAKQAKKVSQDTITKALSDLDHKNLPKYYDKTIIQC